MQRRRCGDESRRRRTLRVRARARVRVMTLPMLCHLLRGEGRLHPPGKDRLRVVRVEEGLEARREDEVTLCRASQPVELPARSRKAWLGVRQEADQPVHGRSRRRYQRTTLLIRSIRRVASRCCSQLPSVQGQPNRPKQSRKAHPRVLQYLASLQTLLLRVLGKAAGRLRRQSLSVSRSRQRTLH